MASPARLVSVTEEEEANMARNKSSIMTRDLAVLALRVGLPYALARQASGAKNINPI
jgi:hypothetical protein